MDNQTETKAETGAETKRVIPGLCEALKKNRRTVWGYIKRGMPTDEAGAREWVAANVRTSKAGKLADATHRLKAAQADLAELEAAEKRGELMPYEDVQRWASEATVIVTSQLEGLPGRMAATLAGMNDAAQVRQALLDEVRRIRSAFAAALAALVPADVEAGDAAAEEDARRVGGPDEDPAAG